MSGEMFRIVDRDGNEVTCTGQGKYSSICPVCQSTVLIHCAECGIQITGCRCTLRSKLDA